MILRKEGVEVSLAVDSYRCGRDFSASLLMHGMRASDVSGINMAWNWQIGKNNMHIEEV